MWMDVDAALAAVPMNVMPLIDDTDFKTIEDSLVYNQSGLALKWNFVGTDGSFTQTAVTPTTGGGDYDWINKGGGMYSIGIPASGGASINNDTEGFGWFTGKCTGVLAWSGPRIGFRAAGLNNLLIDLAYSATRGLGGTALPDAAADAAGGLPISDAGGLDLDTLLGYLTGAVALASVCTETRLAELDAANLPADIDTIAVDVAGLDGAAMRGTDNANTTTPPTVDEIWAKAMSDLAQGAPSATASVLTAINYLYEAWRNKTLTTSSEVGLYADDGTTKIVKSAISDDGTTFTKGEMASGA